MAGRSSCPVCGTILRIRDRSFVGRKVSCPECKTALRVEATERQDEFVTRRITPVETQTIERPAEGPKSNPSKATISTVSRRSIFRRVAGSPLTAGFLVAIAMASLVAVLLLNPRFRLTSARPVPVRKIPNSPVDPIQEIDPIEPEIVEIPPQPEAIGPTTSIDDANSISALEPANVEGTLPWPPVSIASDTTESIAPPQPIPAKIDVKGKMGQEIISYKQPKVSRRDLIDALDEQLGAPIRYDVEELGAADLDEKVAIDLENTTIGEVIQAVAKAAGWQVLVEDTGIRLTRQRRSSAP